MRPGNTKTVYDLDKISIHAPREGCDVFVPDAEGFSAISIHAPREGCDSAAPPIPLVIIPISIHAPREGCDAVRGGDGDGFLGISIHAPREGCDYPGRAIRSPRIHFNPRTP